MRKPFIVEEYGSFLSVSGENITLKTKESKVSESLKNLSYIVINGSHAGLSSALILKCLKRKIPIIIADDLGRPRSIISEFKRADDTRERQLKFSSHSKSISFVCKILKEKIRKQHQTLHYHIRSLRLNGKDEVKNIEGYNHKHFLASFDVLAKRKTTVKKISKDIFLLEARSSRSYWRAFSKLFPKILFPGRQKRDTEDPVNKLLNYGYALLSSSVLKETVFAGLDPTVPLLHHRKGLTFPFVFDLMEPFRPLADHAVISFFHKQKKQILGKKGKVRKSVLRRFRKYWFEKMKNPRPWSKSDKSLEKLIGELLKKYKKSAGVKF